MATPEKELVKQVEDIDWEFILGSIKKGKCVIVIGPQVNLTREGKPLMKQLLKDLPVGEGENILKFYPGDDFFLFKDPMAKTKTLYKIQGFFEAAYPGDPAKPATSLDIGPIDKIIDIPFSVIVSTSPDHFVKQRFLERGIEVDFQVYNKSSNPVDITPPGKDRPLLYNFFGSIEEEESLILTHDDLFDFMEAVMGNRHLPQNLKDSLTNVDNFLFVGCSFDKWYVQVLLRLFQIHQQAARFFRFAPQEHLNDDTLALCIEQFKLIMVEGDGRSFLNVLHQKCEQAGLLRTGAGADQEQAALPRARIMAKNGQVKEAAAMLLREDLAADAVELLISYNALVDGLELLETLFEKAGDQAQKSTTTHLKAQANLTAASRQLNTIDANEASIQNSRVIQGALNLIAQYRSIHA